VCIRGSWTQGKHESAKEKLVDLKMKQPEGIQWPSAGNSVWGGQSGKKRETSIGDPGKKRHVISRKKEWNWGMTGRPCTRQQLLIRTKELKIGCPPPENCFGGPGETPRHERDRQAAPEWGGMGKEGAHPCKPTEFDTTLQQRTKCNLEVGRAKGSLK